MDNLKIEYLKVEDLIPYVNNPRDNKVAVDKVANSIEEFGFKNPIIVDQDNVIVAGHTRLLASKQLGLEEVPTIRVKDLNSEQIKAFRLADNKTSEFAEWNENLLELELLGIDDIDMSKFGFELEDTEEKEKTRQSNLKSMPLKAFEHYDYLVFVFKNQQDWLNAVNKFKIERVNSGYGKTKKVGVGRVLDGKRLLEEV